MHMACPVGCDGSGLTDTNASSLTVLIVPQRDLHRVQYPGNSRLFMTTIACSDLDRGACTHINGDVACGQDNTGATNVSVRLKNQSMKSTMGVWKSSCKNVKPTMSRARSMSTPSIGNIQKGLIRFGNASAAL